MTDTLIQRDSSLKQINRLLKPFGMQIDKPVTKDSSGRVIDTSPKTVPKKNIKSRKVYKKVTQTKPIPQKAKPSKPKKSTIFGISFKSGGKIGSKKSKKQSGHNRLY